VNDKYASFSPCILTGLLDAYLENEGFKSEIIDLEVDRYTAADLKIKLQEIKPRWVGILATGVNVSASTQSMPSVINLFKEVLTDLKKIQNFYTFVYGGHPTVLPLRTLQETSADYVVIGEGYSTVTRLLQIKKETKINEINGLAYMEAGQFIKTPSVELIDM
jgi:radical SAM superfamily enzyme YgiQ (UPF0313 family)